MDVDVRVPLTIQVPVRGPVTVVNNGHVPVYYRGNPAVSATSHDGSLAAGATLKLIQTTWFLASAAGARIDYISPYEPGDEGQPYGPALLGEDGTIGGTGGSPLSNAVVTTSTIGTAGQAAKLDAHGAVQSAIVGEENTATGKNALAAVTTGKRNTATGENALAKLTTGSYNVANGHNALEALQTGKYNTAIGDDALLRATNEGNTAVGTSALQLLTTGENNVGMGVNAGRYITTANMNVVIGAYAAEGVEEPAGSEEGKSLGPFNVVIGGRALEKAVGVESCIAVGYRAGNGLAGNNNIVIGNEAGMALGNGGTVAVGVNALEKCTGMQHVAVGHKAGANVTAGEACVIVGHNAGPVTVGAYSNKLYIHNEASDSPLILGDFAAKTIKFNLAAKARPATIEAVGLLLHELGFCE